MYAYMHVQDKSKRVLYLNSRRKVRRTPLITHTHTHTHTQYVHMCRTSQSASHILLVKESTTNPSYLIDNRTGEQHCICTCMYLCMYPLFWLVSHTCICTYIHTYVRTYIHTCIYMHTYTCIRTHAYICGQDAKPRHHWADMHSYIPTYIHTYIHTYTQTHTHADKILRVRQVAAPPDRFLMVPAKTSSVLCWDEPLLDKTVDVIPTSANGTQTATNGCGLDLSEGDSPRKAKKVRGTAGLELEIVQRGPTKAIVVRYASANEPSKSNARSENIRDADTGGLNFGAEIDGDRVVRSTVKFTLVGLGLSLIDTGMEEILYASLTGVKGVYVLGCEEESYEVWICVCVYVCLCVCMCVCR